jgi:cyclopropane-fatty-acyl-phospholipid synthase
MLLHTIVRPTFGELRRRGLTLTRELVHFSEFILAEIFPGGWLPTVPVVVEHAAKVGFAVTRIQSLQAHYVRTLDKWAAALRANKEQAIATQSPDVYDRYMKYLTGCAKLFHDGYIDVNQFALQRTALS